MFTTTTRARLALYGVFGVVLALILTAQMTTIVPGRLGTTISRNSEGFLTILAVCAWIDVVRPRLRRHPQQWVITAGVAVALLVGGLLLRGAPWPSRFVTLNEALLAIAVLVVYLQLARPLPWWAVAVLPVFAVVVAAVGGTSPFTTDLAESLGALVLVPLVVDVADRRLLDGGPPPVVRDVVVAAAALLLILAIHAVTPKNPVGTVEELTYYLQRTTEMFIAAAVLLVYYASRRRGAPASGHPTAATGHLHDVADRLTPEHP